MKIKLTVIGIISLLLTYGCHSKTKTGQEQTGVHKVELKEFLQTSNYTYLKVVEKGKEEWLAVPKMEAKVGQTYYYKGGMEMPGFKSNELNREFKSVLFLGKVSTSPDLGVTQPILSNAHSTSAIETAKLDLSLEPAKGGLSIAELVANKEKYNGKVARIKGKVTKVNSQIMGKNWIHIQDGTEHDGIYELTVTTKLDFKVGDTINLEGKIALNKDFGAGYLYDIIMEEATLVK